MNANACVCLYDCRWRGNCIGCFSRMFKIIFLLNDFFSLFHLSSVWKRLVLLQISCSTGFYVLVGTAKLAFLFLRVTRVLHLMVNPLRLWSQGLFLKFSCIPESSHHLHKENKNLHDTITDYPKDLCSSFLFFFYYQLQYSCPRCV